MEYNKNLIEEFTVEDKRYYFKASRVLRVLSLVCFILIILSMVGITITSLPYVLFPSMGKPWVVFTSLISLMIFIIAVVGYLITTECSKVVEEKLGYYKCNKCGYTHKYDSSKDRSMRFFVGRFMFCEECKKWSIHKKVFSKDIVESEEIEG